MHIHMREVRPWMGRFEAELRIFVSNCHPDTSFRFACIYRWVCIRRLRANTCNSDELSGLKQGQSEKFSIPPLMLQELDYEDEEVLILTVAESII